MQVLRNSQPITLAITATDARPTIENLSDLINPSTDLIAPLGIFCIDLKGPMASTISTRSETGVVVAGLVSGEPATLADLQPGDIIRSINGQPVTDTAHLREQLSGLKTGNAVVLEVERQSVIQYVAFEME